MRCRHFYQLLISQYADVMLLFTYANREDGHCFGQQKKNFFFYIEKKSTSLLFLPQYILNKSRKNLSNSLLSVQNTTYQTSIFQSPWHHQTNLKSINKGASILSRTHVKKYGTTETLLQGHELKYHWILRFLEIKHQTNKQTHIFVLNLLQFTLVCFSK